MRMRTVRRTGGGGDNFRYGNDQTEYCVQQKMQSEAVCQLQATPEETDLSAKDCLRFLFVAALDEQT